MALESVLPIIKLAIWALIVVFALLVYGKETRPLVQLLVDFIVRMVRS